MNTAKLATFTIAYGVFLIASALAAHWTSTDGLSTALIIFTAGGVVCSLLGFVGLRGLRFLAWTILTLVIVNFVLISQVVFGWAEKLQGESGGNLSRALLTLILAVSIGFVAYLANVGDRQRSSAERGNTRA